MSTVALRFGPADHGRPVTDDELDHAEYEPGYRYEVIDGRLDVSPVPNPPENELELWLFVRLLAYSAARPDVINHVTNKARVFVPGRPRLTAPEPDVAAYRDYPRGRPTRSRRWAAVSPVVVAEVLVDGDPQKDLERNAGLYLAVPTIAEYWVVDGRDDPGRPTLVVHARAGDRWDVREVPFGHTFATPALPGFSLLVDPDR